MSKVEERDLLPGSTTDEERALLDRELEEYRQNPGAGSSWNEVEARLRTRFVAVLEIPPVDSAETAVRVQIVKDIKAKSP